MKKLMFAMSALAISSAFCAGEVTSQNIVG